MHVGIERPFVRPIGRTGGGGGGGGIELRRGADFDLRVASTGEWVLGTATLGADGNSVVVVPGGGGGGGQQTSPGSSLRNKAGWFF